MENQVSCLHTAFKPFFSKFCSCISTYRSGGRKGTLIICWIASLDKLKQEKETATAVAKADALEAAVDHHSERLSSKLILSPVDYNTAHQRLCYAESKDK